VHRFNRAQQDSFLPVMEDGTVVLVGATTENPSFELNAALLSRARVLVFQSLDTEAVEAAVSRAPKQVEGQKAAARMPKPAPCWCAWRTAMDARR
jgi:putative ATPase